MRLVGYNGKAGCKAHDAFLALYSSLAPAAAPLLAKKLARLNRQIADLFPRGVVGMTL